MYPRVSATVSSVIQKLCSILGFLKDLLSVERLTDSCILQLVKTSFSTFLVDNVQLLQLKSINLICGVIFFFDLCSGHTLVSIYACVCLCIYLSIYVVFKNAAFVSRYLRHTHNTETS